MGVFSQDLKNEVASTPETRWEGLLGSREVVLIAKPLSPLDLKYVTGRHREFMSNPNMEGMVDLLIHKTRTTTQEGPAFDASDKPMLMRMATTKISGIFQALFGDQLEANADEEIEKHKGN